MSFIAYGVPFWVGLLRVVVVMAAIAARKTAATSGTMELPAALSCETRL